MPTTSQINPGAGKRSTGTVSERGEKDIFYILLFVQDLAELITVSGWQQNCQEEYPGRKLIVIHSAPAWEGLLVYKAVQLKRAGKSLEEVAAWVEENKLPTSCTTLRLMIYSIYIEAEEYQRLLLLLER